MDRWLVFARRSRSAWAWGGLDPGERSERRATEEAARTLRLVVSYIPFTGVGQLDGGLSAVRDARADAFELALNLKTGKAIGVTIPQSVLVRADEVIR